MRIDIATIFPAMFAGPLGTSILARAQEAGLLDIRIHDLRDHTSDRHRTVDDYPYGGGAGMVMRPGPFFSLYDSLVGADGESGEAGSREAAPVRPRPRVVLFSPAGKVLSQQTVRRYAGEPWLLLICGHYEGIDDRVAAGLGAEEISLGDFVLTGGELPAMVLVDGISRLLPGVLGTDESLAEESFTAGLLEYPQFTRPPEIRGLTVPAVLLSGDHPAVHRWRREQSLLRTAQRRPELLASACLTEEERAMLERAGLGAGADAGPDAGEPEIIR